MFNMDQALRVATAAVGALIFTTVAVGATVSPGHAAQTNPAVYAQANGAGHANG